MFAVSSMEGLAGVKCIKKGDRSKEPEGIALHMPVGKLCFITGLVLNIYFCSKSNWIYFQQENYFWVV